MLTQSIKNRIIDIKNKASDEGITKQSALRDMLTDLRHAAKELNLDFDFAVEGSEEVFILEGDEE